MSLAALIFDVDGTLAETEEAHRAAFNQAFAEWGLDWHWDRALYARLLDVTGGKERLRHFRDDWPSEPGAERLASEEAVVALHRRKTDIYITMISSGAVPLRPGVRRLMEEARAEGLRLAIATTTNIGPLEALLEGTLGPNALAGFDAIAAGDMVANKKPAPDVYRLALRELGLEAGSCLALEDSRNGLLAARGAGLGCLITVSAYSEGQDFTGALAVISDLGEPDAPFEPLTGLAEAPGVVDVPLLRRWHDAARAAPCP